MVIKRIFRLEFVFLSIALLSLFAVFCTDFKRLNARSGAAAIQNL